VVVGTPVAGRHYAEMEDLVGPVVNTLVLRVDLTSDPTRDMFGDREVPFERVDIAVN
jgi:hypothetical protein